MSQYLMKGVLVKMKRCFLLSFVFVFMLTSVLAVADDDEIENLVKGGDFEDDADMTNWSAFSSGGATIVMERDNKEAAVGDVSVMLEVTGVDAASPWNPQFRQLPYGTAMTIEEGMTYTLSMFMKADKPRDIQMLIFREVPSYEVRFSKTVNLGTEWEEYWVTGTAPEDSQVAMKLLNAGAGKGFYWVDGIRFYEGEYVPTFEEEKAVALSESKLSTTWGAIRSR